MRLIEAKTNINTLLVEERYSEKSSSRRIEVKASDSAVDKLATAVGGLMSPFANGQRKISSFNNPSLPRIPLNNIPTNLQSSKKTIEVSSQEIYLDNQINSDVLEKADEVEITSDVLLEFAQNYFKEDIDGSIIPLDALRSIRYGSLENTNKAKLRGLVILYITAYEAFREKCPSKEEIYGLVKKEKMYDSNFRDDFNKKFSREFLTVVESDRWALDFNGRKQLNKLINQIYNPVETESHKRKSRTGRPKGSVSSVSSEKIDQWLEKELDSTLINLNKLKTAKSWGLFGYYLLLKVLSVDDVILSGDVYIYLMKKFKSINVKKNQFQDAVNKTKSLFIRSVGGGYSLSPEGVVEAKKIMGISE